MAMHDNARHRRMKSVSERLRALSPGRCRDPARHREGKPARAAGRHARPTPHPPALGSALTHPHITTDFSEAQLELITGVHADGDSLSRRADADPPVRLPRTSATRCCGARACRATCPTDDAIPIARYGSSNVGRAKTVYRTGLSHRYGRRMQMISGIHYNFSLRSGRCRARRRQRRLLRADPQLPPPAWLLLYLFGASPAVCASFVEGRAHELASLRPAPCTCPVPRRCAWGAWAT